MDVSRGCLLSNWVDWHAIFWEKEPWKGQRFGDEGDNKFSWGS